MVISDKYRYVFLETPYTASTATRWELVEHYDGRKVLSRHAPYSEFLKIATAEQKQYFVIAGIRNPLDSAVSVYLQMRSNHNNTFSRERMDLTQRQEPLGFLKVKRLEIAQMSQMDYPTYFKKVFTLPYTNYVNHSAKHIDFLIRFEHLQEDFAEALSKLNIEQKRDLPQANKTKQKKSYSEYYTPDIIGRAKRVFGPFMTEWGYELPPSWGSYSVTLPEKLTYNLIKTVKNIYWTYSWSKVEAERRQLAEAG